MIRHISKPIAILFTLFFTLNVIAQQSTDDKLAGMFLQNKEYEKAAAIYERLYNEKPSSYYYTYYLFCLVQIRDFKTAEKFIIKEKKRNAGNPKYDVDLGYVYIENNEVEKAKDQFEKAIDQIKPDKQQITALANSFRSRRQNDWAIKTYVKGRQLLNDNYSFNLEMGDVYAVDQNHEKMIEEYLDMLEFDINYLSAVQNRLQNALNKDPDGRQHELLKKELLKRIQKFPDKNYYAEMLLWLSIQEKDFELALIQAKSLDRRLGEDGERVYDLAQLCTSNKNYEVAAEAYSYLINLGEDNRYYLSSRIGFLNVNYLIITNSYNYTKEDIVKLKDDYLSTIKEFGKNAPTIPLMRYLAHLQAFYLDECDSAIALLDETIEIPNAPPGLKAECKLELADILLFTGEVWDATLLYSQVEKAFKNEPIGHEAKFRNAKLSYYIGEFEWAKAQLDVLKAATSKLIANDAMDLSLLISDNIDIDSSTTALGIYSRAELLLFRNKYDRALQTLDSIKDIAVCHPLADEVLYKKAEIMIRKGQYEEADTLLQQLVELYPYDILADDALFKRAELYELQFKDIPKAMELYESILLNYSGSLYASEARRNFRRLRGDDVELPQ